MKEIKAVIFDLDGIVVDTADFHFKSWKRLAKNLGIELEDSINSRLKGVSRMQALNIILELGDKSYSEMELVAMATLKNEWYLEQVSQLTNHDILPGILDYLEELKTANLQIGLASASKNARPILNTLGLNEYFHAIVDGTSTQKAKPNPEVFLSCARQLGVENEGCIVIEDAVAGVQAAKAAGMKVIGVGDSNELAQADLVIGSTESLSLQFVVGFFCSQ